MEIKKLKNGNFAILEKVQPSVSVINLVSNNINQNRFGTNIEQNRLLHGVDKEIFDADLKLARIEYNHKFSGIDKYDGNILILDYNPKTKKFLFGPIDFSGQGTKSMPD